MLAMLNIKLYTVEQGWVIVHFLFNCVTYTIMNAICAKFYNKANFLHNAQHTVDQDWLIGYIINSAV